MGERFGPERLVALLARFGRAARCWIAFSGGLDSTALLSAAAAVRERLPGVLHAVHVDHGLHPDAAGWAEHCRAVCDACSIPFVSERLCLRPVPGESLEAVAREARYGAFARLLAPGELMLTAHTQDDQAETLLLALLRGSGTRGLAAMPLESRLGAGHLVRPLLDVTRRALSDYVRGQGLSWIEDPSNGETGFDRNYLRHRVMPLLRARWPACGATLSRSAAHCAEASFLTDRLAEDALEQVAGARPATLDVAGLAALDRRIAKAVLRSWLARAGLSLPDARQVARILDELPAARADANPLVAWAGCEVRRYRGDLYAMGPLPKVPGNGLSLDWPVGAGASRLALPNPLGWLEWRQEPGGRALGRDSMASEDALWREGSRAVLTVRFGQSGRQCLAVPAGHHRPMKKLFQEAGIPVWLRPYVPLLMQGDALIGVAGLCPCASVPAGAGLAGRLRWTGHPWEGCGLFRADWLALHARPADGLGAVEPKKGG